MSDIKFHDYTTDQDFMVLKQPERSDWRCYMFGGKPGTMGLVYQPTKGNEPNWFWRKMQYLAFGNLWVYEPNKKP